MRLAPSSSIVDHGGTLLRQAIANLPPAQRREVEVRLGPPWDRPWRPRERPRRMLLALLAWIRECCETDPNLYAAPLIGDRR